jgi:hypothetical protein
MSRIAMADGPGRSTPAIRWDRVFTIVAIAGAAIVVGRAVFYYLKMPDPGGAIGVDFRLYVDYGARRWLHGDGFYWPQQVAGPYLVHSLPSLLYPPVILLILVPFTVLPAPLYWLIPGALLAGAIIRLRPAPWALATMTLLGSMGEVQGPIFWGTPVIWLVPAVAWGFILGWPAGIVLLKPTLAPFALVGLHRRRRFALGMVGLAALSLPFLPLWFDWLAAMRNSDLDLAYGWTQVFLLLVPLVAILGRTREREPTTTDNPAAASRLETSAV